MEGTFGSALLPICIMRRPKGNGADASRPGPPASSSASGAAPPPASMPLAAEMQRELASLGKSAASAVSDALGGALDGALSAMKVR